jgi:tetratricopeptide (TPR) repeat protein
MSPTDSGAAPRAHALLLQGAALYRSGEAARARDVCLQALEAEPDSVETLLFLALIALHEQDPAASIDWANRALALNGASLDAYVVRGEAQQRAGQHAAAASSYEAALRLEPDHADALNQRGNALYALGLYEPALANYERAARCAPASAVFRNNVGLASQALGHTAAAIDHFRAALALDPDYGLAHFNLGLALFAGRRYRAAADAQRAALARLPRHAAAHWGLADALCALGDYDAALAAYDAAHALDPYHPAIVSHRGLALHYAGRHEAALDAFAAALRLDPEHADAHCNRALVLDALGRHADALDAYDAALALAPGHASAHLNRGLCLLALGRYPEGWAGFEWRHASAQFGAARRRFAVPQWTGQPLPPRARILLHAEQGLGDTLQFCRYVPLVAALGAEVTVQVQAPLVGLVGRMPGVARAIAPDAPLPDCDLHCPLPSLPYAFGTTLDTVPAPRRYLAPPDETARAWAARLGPRRRARIGLVWAGAPHAAQAVLRPLDARRSIPLEQFAPLGAVQAEFHSLQVGEAALAQWHALRQTSWPGPALVDHSDALRDFDDTAALVDQLDLVLAVDTSVAHLAGALGRPVWLLNRFDSCWRWLDTREDSPWYPTMRVLRQPAAGDWDSVIARVCAELAQALPALRPAQ